MLVILRPQSRLMLEGRTRMLSGPSPDLRPAWSLASNGPAGTLRPSVQAQRSLDLRQQGCWMRYCGIAHRSSERFWGVALVGLVLGMAEFAGPRRWRWLLTDEDTGQPLADHQVNLEGEPGDFEAFTGLYRYLRWNAVPDRRTSSEAEITARVGAWAGIAVLGQPVARAILDAAPVTVRVEVPGRAGFVLGWPLELAHAGGQPLAARGDVTLVYDLGVSPGRGMAGWRSADEELRMLAVFSLPTRTSVLALRRERHELARLVRRIGARQQRRMSLSLLQYGVTRERLAEVVDSGDGWDVLHLSGHGGRGQFLLNEMMGPPTRWTLVSWRGCCGRCGGEYGWRWCRRVSRQRRRWRKRSAGWAWMSRLSILNTRTFRRHTRLSSPVDQRSR